MYFAFVFCEDSVHKLLLLLHLQTFSCLTEIYSNLPAITLHHITLVQSSRKIVLYVTDTGWWMIFFSSYFFLFCETTYPPTLHMRRHPASRVKVKVTMWSVLISPECASPKDYACHI